MVKNKQLGIYWGQTAFCLVEAEKKQVLNTSTISFDTPLETSETQDVPEGLKFTTLLEQAIKQKGISTKKTNLSLPSHEFIFRSFIIPWMQPDEIKSVVDFEATKYIPVSLDDLSYTFHPIQFTENGQKNMRILFVAIRKDILERYTGILAHTGLHIGHIEPSCVSITRVLQKQGYISSQKPHAIIYIGQTDSEIIIIENGIVQFVRKFQLPESQSDPAFLNAQLFNDIRVSFNFYSRQSSNASIEKIIVLSSRTFPDLSKDLTNEFELPASAITSSEIIKSESTDDVGLLDAYGAAQGDKVSTSKDFDLSDKAARARLEGISSSIQEKYKTTAIIVAACALIVVGTILYSNNMVSSQKNRLIELNLKQSSVFKSSKVAAIKELKTKKLNKLTKYQDIRQSSNTPLFLAVLPRLLPKGVWLSGFQIEYIEKTKKVKSVVRYISKPKITLNGMAYHENPNEQFRIINNLVSSLRNDVEFSKYFNVIERTAAGQKKIDDYRVTSFTIICKNEDEDE